MPVDLKANIPDLNITSKLKSTLKRLKNSKVTTSAPPSYKTSSSSLKTRGAAAPELTRTTWPHRWDLIYIFVILTIEDA